MRLRFVALSLALVAAPGAAQEVPVGSCERGDATATLETPNLVVPFRTDGRFWGGGSRDRDRLRYLLPRPEGVSPVAGASLWLSGYVEDSLRVTARTHDPGDFWPGPLADAEAPPTDCSAWDRIWVVSRADVEDYYTEGVATADLAEWPYQAGAPVLDGDGDPTNYDLAAGDQPDLIGDVAAFWVMNDAGNAHGLTPEDEVTAPLGVEVRAHAFAFVDSPFPGVPPLALRDASFLRVEVVNRRPVPIDSLRLSLFVDAAIGAFDDDLVGTDTLRNLAYFYNGDPVDEGGYGDVPPSWGVQVLRGPIGLANGWDDDFDGDVDEADERLGLTAAPYMPPSERFVPETPAGFVSVQVGRLATGESYDVCRARPLPGWQRLASFAYPGRTPDWCSEYSGGYPSPSDRRLSLTVGATSLAPAERAAYLFAVPFARASPDERVQPNLQSVRRLVELASGFLEVFGAGVPSRRVEPPTVPLPETLALTRVRPNPSAGGAEAVLSLSDPAEVTAEVVDALGRRLAVVAEGTLPAGASRLAIPDGLPPGAYLLRVSVRGRAEASVPFTVVR